MMTLCYDDILKGRYQGDFFQHLEEINNIVGTFFVFPSLPFASLDMPFPHFFLYLGMIDVFQKTKASPIPGVVACTVELLFHKNWLHYKFVPHGLEESSSVLD